MAKEGEVRECPECGEKTLIWTHIRRIDPASVARGDNPPDVIGVDQAWICDCGHRDDVGINLHGTNPWPTSD